MKTYITEKDIGPLLEILFPDKEIIHNKKHFLGFRPDYYIPECSLILEFDGYHHYTDNNFVLKDLKKDKLAIENGQKLIRIPYFIQIHVGIVDILFSEHSDIRIEQNYNDYPIGFIDEKAALPGTFSSLGLLKYKKQLSLFGAFDIYKSLIDKVVKENKDYLLCFPETSIREVENTYEVCHKIVTNFYSEQDKDKFNKAFLDNFKLSI